MAAAKTSIDDVIHPQPVAAPLTRAAIFLVVTINPGSNNHTAVRSFCADLPALSRAVEFRNLEAGLTCVMGIGSEAWDRLFGHPRPAELHRFREIRAGSRHAVSSPGDLLFHIRAKRMDLCFELATRVMASLGDAVSAVDEVHGFRYFDDRDLLGFVDGTENPRGQAVIDAAVIGEEDRAFAGGSYVIVQKYLHDMDGWCCWYWARGADATDKKVWFEIGERERPRERDSLTGRSKGCSRTLPGRCRAAGA